MEEPKQQFSKRYVQMSDDQLLYEFGMISQLRPEAAEAMRTEVQRRKLDTSLVPAYAPEAQFVGGEMVAWSIYKKIVYWNAVIGICVMLFVIIASLLGFGAESS